MSRVLLNVVLGGAVLLGGCQAVNTTSGGAVGVQRQQYMFSLLSSAQLEQMYAQAYQETLSKAQASGKLDRSSALARRVDGITRRLIAQTPVFRPDALNWNWETSLLDIDELNANVGPGGKIIVYGGLIHRLALTDDELAAVLGHEIAHALREHSREAMSKAYAGELAKQGVVTLLGLGELGNQVAGAALQYGMTLPNSRGSENEADLIGLELAARAGFNPGAALTLWEKMARAGGAGGPEFMSTHPSSATRMSNLRAAIPRVMPLYEQSRR